MAHSDASLVEHTSAAPPLADPLPAILATNQPIRGGGFTAASVLALQRTAGNQGVARMLSARAKSIGDATDRAEAPGGAPVEVVIALVDEDAEAGEAAPEGAEATSAPADAGARQKRSAGAPVEISVASVQPGTVRSGPGLELRSKATTSVAGGAAPTNALTATDYGLTMEESIVPTIGAKKVGATWHPVVTSLLGNFSQQVRLLPGQSEVTGPGGNTTKTNFCDQVKGLKTLGNTIGNTWYMLQAVKDHEDVHAAHFGPGLKAAEPTITAALEAVSIPDVPGMTQITAATALAANGTFKAAVTAALQTWIAQDNILLAGDHAAGGPTDVAEHKVVDPMITSICAHAKKEKWPACADCPP